MEGLEENSAWMRAALKRSGGSATPTSSSPSSSTPPPPAPAPPPPFLPEHDASFHQACALAAQANEVFIRDKDYGKAVQLYTQAIQMVPGEVKFFGNRSMCRLFLGDASGALEDADVCAQLEPTWAKGHYRRASALESLNRLAEAEAAYDTAIKYSGAGSILNRDYSAARMLCQIRQLQAMGFGKETATAAMLEHGSVRKAAERLSSTRMAQVGSELLDSDDESALMTPQHPPSSAPLVSLAPSRPLSCATNVAPHPPKSTRGNEETWRPSRVSTPPSLPDGPLTDPKNPLHCDTIWVGNLGPGSTETELRRKFAMFGRIRNLALMLDRHCGFITYSDYKSAGKAMSELQGAQVHGASIVIKYPDRYLAGPAMKNLILKKKTK